MADDSLNLLVDEDERRRFEAAWVAGAAPRIEAFLPPPQSPAFLGTLEELVKIELELSWKKSQFLPTPPPLVETFLSRFPQLNDPAITRRLLRQEHQVRHEYGDRPSKAVFAARFPGLFGGDDPFSRSFDVTDENATAAMTVAADSGDADGIAAAPGSELPGYDVLKVIGRGGMGIVLQARDRALNRLVAIKLPLHGSLSKSESDRFLREARSVAKLRHPNICPIYEVGEHRRRPYIAMAFIDGPTLQAWAGAANPTARQCADMIAKVARAVGYAHEHGVIHRDIKPANVLVEADTNEPLLTDFGLAKEVSSAQSLMTQDGTVLGTPAYMSPEQAAGRLDKIGPPADVYSLGAVLYQLLCGRLPFSGTVGEILRQVQTDTVVPLRRYAPRVHRDLETICMKALGQEPGSRYPTGRAMADDLERFNAGEAILARREGPRHKLLRILRRHPRQVASFFLILLLAASSILFFARGSSRTHKAAQLRQQVEAAIDTGRWNEEHLSSIDALLEQLSELDTHQAQVEKSRVLQALGSSVDELLRQPTLVEATLTQLDREIALLSNRAPDRAVALQEAVRKRKRTWETVYDLQPPFTNLQNLPDPAVVKVANNSLVFTPPDGTISNGYAPLKVSGSCVGNVQVEVVLEPGWEASSLPVLTLGGTGENMSQSLKLTGYAFHVEVEIGAGSDSLVASVSRSGLRLRTWRVKAGQLQSSDFDRGSLRILAGREDNRLSLQLNDLPPFIIEDSFPSRPPGDPLYVVYLPPGARVRRLRAVRQSNPVTPSALEQGDELFNTNRFPEALAYYQKQTIESVNRQSAQESRFKQALCLVKLKDDAAAADLLEQVMAEPGTRLPALAGCQLLLVRMRQQRRADADAIFRTLRSRFLPDQLDQFVSDDVRQKLLEGAPTFTGLGMFSRVNPEAIENARQAREFSRLITTEVNMADVVLVRAYEVAGQTDAALAVAEETIAKAAVPQQYNVLYANYILEDYGLMKRQRHEAAGALKKLDALLYGPKGEISPGNIPLLVEGARLHAAMDDPGRAQRDLDDCIRLSAASPQSYSTEAAAALLRGFLREDAGNGNGARADWEYASFKGFIARHRLAVDAGLDAHIEGLNSCLLLLISGSLADNLSDDDIQRIITRQVAKLSAAPDTADGRGESAYAAVVLLFQSGAMQVPPSTLREIWRTPRGRTIARQIVFRALPLSDLARQTMALGIYQFVRQGCTTVELPPDQDALLWDHSMACVDAMRSHEFRKEQLLKMFLTWSGTTGFLGWGGVEKSLKPEFRAGMAYVFGRRFLFLQKPAEAEKMFRRTLADAPEESHLHQAAAAELQLLAAPRR